MVPVTRLAVGCVGLPRGQGRAVAADVEVRLGIVVTIAAVDLLELIRVGQIVHVDVIVARRTVQLAMDGSEEAFAVDVRFVHVPVAIQAIFVIRGGNRRARQ